MNAWRLTKRTVGCWERSADEAAPATVDIQALMQARYEPNDMIVQSRFVILSELPEVLADPTYKVAIAARGTRGTQQ